MDKMLVLTAVAILTYLNLALATTEFGTFAVEKEKNTVLRNGLQSIRFGGLGSSHDQIPMTKDEHGRTEHDDYDKDDHKGNNNEDTLSSQKNKHKQALTDMLDAIHTMQDTYYDVYAGIWPDAIDWTAAIMGSHISATLSSLVLGLKDKNNSDFENFLSWENVVNKYYTHTSLYYFGERALVLRGQAYDDMLWVVLGWLENVKFAEMYSAQFWEERNVQWHGLQTTVAAAHRARIFYELASVGWDTELCGGGMVWSPYLEPYKNAITNELFAVASIGMYLYFPGDNNTSPFVADQYGRPRTRSKPHDPAHLEYALKSYKWLQESRMRNFQGLYRDGFHVSGWNRRRDGTIDPGTGKCDDPNNMVYTYNQGVILSASRGLWVATGSPSYLDDGHELIMSVVNATGWPIQNNFWSGLGRGGVLEELCDHRGWCSQDGQSFKGIFFHHLIEFCRPLRPQEEDFLATNRTKVRIDQVMYKKHLKRCASYGDWIEHNAKAALRTRDERGLFGMWWGVSPDSSIASDHDLGPHDLQPGAEDYLNPRPATMPDFKGRDLNSRGRGRTVETQSGGLAVVKAHWQWVSSNMPH